MERIPGVNLEVQWPLMRERKQIEALISLAAILQKMQNDKGSCGYCSTNYQALPDEAHFDPPDHFNTEQDLNAAMIQLYRNYLGPQYWADHHARVFAGVLKDHLPVLTHGRLQRQDVIVRADGTVALTGWSHAGKQRLSTNCR
jgi:hypothetical protein